jgi:hypothetical protein
MAQYLVALVVLLGPWVPRLAPYVAATARGGMLLRPNSDARGMTPTSH